MAHIHAKILPFNRDINEEMKSKFLKGKDEVTKWQVFALIIMHMFRISNKLQALQQEVNKSGFETELFHC